MPNHQERVQRNNQNWTHRRFPLAVLQEGCTIVQDWDGKSVLLGYVTDRFENGDLWVQVWGTIDYWSDKRIEGMLVRAPISVT